MSINCNLEVLCIGNELLIGKTLNTNAQWLGKRIAALGLQISRITTVSDNSKEISNALKEALNHKPDFIITVGGLGPTFDDKTLAGIAEALKLKLKVNKKALQMIEEKYRNYARKTEEKEIKLTRYRVKMAKLPKGAKPLPNPEGTAPGVLLKQNNTTIIALPGVPSEMKVIFKDSVEPILKEKLGSAYFYETSFYTSGIMESTLAPLIDKTMHDNPHVYVKSHPKGKETKPHIELHLSTTAANPKTAKNRVNKALTHLAKMITKEGGKTRLIDSGATKTDTL